MLRSNVISIETHILCPVCLSSEYYGFQDN